MSNDFNDHGRCIGKVIRNNKKSFKTRKEKRLEAQERNRLSRITRDLEMNWQFWRIALPAWRQRRL